MPPGLRNASGTFLQTLHVTLSSVQWQHVLIYLNDATVFSKTLERHIEHIQFVLTLLWHAAVNPKLKCVCSSQVPSFLFDSLLGKDDKK